MGAMWFLAETFRMDSIPTQVRKELAGLKVDNATEQSILDLSVIRARYGHSAFEWALAILVRAYRERLEAVRDTWEPSLVKPETDDLLKRYLHPFIFMLLCEADKAPADEWVERFRNVDVVDVYTKCLRKAAVDFEVRLKGYDLGLDAN